MENTGTDTAAFPEAIQDETIEPGGAERDTYEELIDCKLTPEERAMTAEEREDAADRRQENLFDGGGSQPPPADDDDSDDDEETFEPTAEALAQAAEDTGRLVRTNSKDAKKRKKARSEASAE